MNNVRLSIWFAAGLLLCACNNSTEPGTQAIQGQCEQYSDGDASECEAEETSTGVCAAAESIDDACEAAYGDQADQCAPFDALDEACEAGASQDDCAAAEKLDDDCEALFGDSAPECDVSDVIDEACSGSDACTSDDECDADETCTAGVCE